MQRLKIKKKNKKQNSWKEDSWNDRRLDEDLMKSKYSISR